MSSNAVPRITTATRADLADCVALLSAQFDEHRIDVADLNRAALGLIDEPSRGAIFLASTRDTRVGIAALSHTWALGHGGTIAWLDELYVIPSMRQNGIGTALLSHALLQARATGCLAVDLEVDSDHARVEGLYERHGFTRLRRSRWALRLAAGGPVCGR
jgi:GNAT superfamily N-acetyltransferase